MFSMILVIIGLCLFEVVSSLDNAVINAEVLSTMSPRGKKWFLTWGLLFAVFAVRGLLPWFIVWAALPQLGPIGALTATFSSDPLVIEAVHHAAPILFMGGGVFLICIFLYWLFLEEKHFGLPGEKFFSQYGIWFYACVSVFLACIVWFANTVNPLIGFSAVVGMTAFFITHGFKQNAEETEKKLMGKHMSDVSKILYLCVIDATFSIDGVLGAFAFTLSVPLILLGNGIGAFVVRELTIHNIERIKKYAYLKNGAMYSILCLGIFMIVESFGIHLPEYVTPLATVVIITYFLYRSIKNPITPPKEPELI